MTQKFTIFSIFGEQLVLTSPKSHQKLCVIVIVGVKKWRVFLKGGRERKHRTLKKGLKMTENAIYLA